MKEYLATAGGQKAIGTLLGLLTTVGALFAAKYLPDYKDLLLPIGYGALPAAIAWMHGKQPTGKTLPAPTQGSENE